MALFLGLDEAGYGPNLGPLVVATTVWRTDDTQVSTDKRDVWSSVQAWYATLKDCVTDQGKIDAGEERIPIADSKVLYKPGGGLDRLEAVVLSACQTCPGLSRVDSDTEHIDGDQLLRGLHGSAVSADEIPWHTPASAGVRRSASAEQVYQYCNQWTHIAECGIELVDVAVRTVFPAEWNRLLAELDNKSSVLSKVSIDLASETLNRHGRDEPAFVFFDKHGGRNRYVPVLQPVFPEYLIETYAESKEFSLYRWGPAARRVECRFSAKGDRLLPSALASMFAKYVREVCMCRFNDFWQSHISGLKATAGYPVDARRFHGEIAPTQARLKISDQVLWRER